MKLEPFQRGMEELARRVWMPAVRKVQNPNRAGLDIVSRDDNFGTLKVNPVFYWNDADLEQYLDKHGLPNEWDYFDPPKADEKRGGGWLAARGREAIKAWLPFLWIPQAGGLRVAASFDEQLLS